MDNEEKILPDLEDVEKLDKAIAGLEDISIRLFVSGIKGIIYHNFIIYYSICFVISIINLITHINATVAFTSLIAVIALMVIENKKIKDINKIGENKKITDAFNDIMNSRYRVKYINSEQINKLVMDSERTISLKIISDRRKQMIKDSENKIV